MKKYFKLVSVCLVVFMLAALALTGCGSSAAETNTATTEAVTAAATEAATTQAATEAKQQTTLQWWQFWSVGDEPDSIKASAVDEYMKANPNVKVEATKLGWGDGFARIQTAIGAGTAPDVLELGSTWVGAFSDVGALSDLTPYVTPEIKDKFINWNLGEQNGKIYAFPWAVGTRALCVNYGLAKKAGLDTSKPPKDWNELRAWAKAIKEKAGVPGFNIAAGDATGDYQTFGDFLYSAGGSMIETKQVDGKDKQVSGLKGDAAKKALNFLMSMKPYSSALKEADAQLAFDNNKLGMFIVGSYQTADIMKNGKAVTDWGFETIPADPDTGKTYAFNGAEVLTVPMQSKNKEEAFKYLTYLADEKTSLKICELCGWSILPSTKTVGDLDVFKTPKDEPAKRVVKFIEIAKNGYTWAPPLNKSVEDIGMRISQMVQEIFLNNTSIDKAIDSADKDINKLYLK